MQRYGVKINFKNLGPRVVELPKPHEFRKSTPVFAMTDRDGTNLVTADQIRTNWNAWAKDYFLDADYPRLTIEDAERKNIEIL